MPQLPGSPAYGLATADPPRDSPGRPWAAFWLAALGTFLAYLEVTLRPLRRARRRLRPG